MATKTKTKKREDPLVSAARRWRAAGLTVERSPHTETRYVSCGPTVRLRVSRHELGVADYGNRSQHHFGPEIIVGDDAGADIVQAAADEVRDWAPGYTALRDESAALLRGLLAARR